MFLHELRKSIKPLMWIVTAGFVASLFFIYIRFSSQGGGEKSLVEVNGKEISYLDFIRAYRDVYDRYIEVAGGKISPEMENYLKSQVLSQLIGSELLYQEAKKAGIKVSDQEVKQQVKMIMSSFGSRENFMRYLELRRINYPDFEAKISRQIAISKLTRLLRDSVIVTDQEVKDYWLARNESVDIAYLFLDPERYIGDIKVSSDEAKKYYEENKEEFKTPEKVSVEYILVSPDEFKDQVNVSEDELRKYYQQHSDEFKVEEKRRASHILIRIAPDADEETKRKAREKIRQIKQKLEEGVDFAELARKYSDDKISAEKGGDLGFFAYDEMTPQFSKAVFSLKKVGDLSGIVETPYGLHLIKLTGIKPGYKRSFDEVKEDIRKALLEEKAERLAQEEIKKIRDKIEKRKISFEEYAKKYPHRAKISPLFARYEKVKDLSRDPRFNEVAFSLKPGKISSPLRIYEGWCIMALKEKKPPYIPKWEEVKDKAARKLAREKAEKITAQRAGEIVKRVKEGEDFSSFAREWEYKTLKSVTRESWINGIPAPDREKFLNTAFSLPSGKISEPLRLSGSYYIIKLLERKVPWEKFAREKDKFRQELLARKREETLTSWFLKIREKAKIVDNTALFFTPSS